MNRNTLGQQTKTGTVTPTVSSVQRFPDGYFLFFEPDPAGLKVGERYPGKVSTGPKTSDRSAGVNIGRPLQPWHRLTSYITLKIMFLVFGYCMLWLLRRFSIDNRQ
jgi:hypothetical protein